MLMTWLKVHPRHNEDLVKNSRRSSQQELALVKNSRRCPAEKLKKQRRRAAKRRRRMKKWQISLQPMKMKQEIWTMPVQSQMRGLKGLQQQDEMRRLKGTQRLHQQDKERRLKGLHRQKMFRQKW
jgi:hypothetical protein